jgi:hypothetical protein
MPARTAIITSSKLWQSMYKRVAIANDDDSEMKYSLEG